MRRHFVLGLCALIGLSVAAATTRADIDTTDPSLPPMSPAKYVSPDDLHALYGTPLFSVLLKRPEHAAIACGQPGASSGVIRTPSGADEIEDFCSEMHGVVDVDSNGDGIFDATEVPVMSQGPTRTIVFGKIGNTTGTFDTEMLSLNLSGVSPFGPFMIRESPTRQSTGKTTITDIGGGMYRINSFFDVFTELSIDGGANWIPDTGGSVRMSLVPEPTSIALGCLGGLALVGCAIRRRRAA